MTETKKNVMTWLLAASICCAVIGTKSSGFDKVPPRTASSPGLSFTHDAVVPLQLSEQELSLSCPPHELYLPIFSFSATSSVHDSPATVDTPQLPIFLPMNCAPETEFAFLNATGR